MKVKVLNCIALLFAVVLFSYGTVNAQVVDAIKDAAEKTKDVTVDATKKTVKVTKDIAGDTKDVTVKGAKKTADVAEDVADVSEDAVDASGDTAVKSYEVVKEGFDDDDDRGIAREIIEATANGTKKAVYYTGDKAADFGKLGYKAGKYVVVKTWDGTKWVSKKTYVFIKGEKKDL